MIKAVDRQRETADGNPLSTDSSEEHRPFSFNNWTIKKLAERFEECVSVFRCLPDSVNLDYSHYWPDIKRTPREVARQEEQPIRLRPLPDAIDRAYETLKWVQLIDNITHRKLIWARAHRLPWRAMQREFGLTRSTAQRHWEKALLEIANNLVQMRTIAKT